MINILIEIQLLFRFLVTKFESDFSLVQDTGGKGKGGKKKGSSFQTVSALHRVRYLCFLILK